MFNYSSSQSYVNDETDGQKMLREGAENGSSTKPRQYRGTVLIASDAIGRYSSLVDLLVAHNVKFMLGMGLNLSIKRIVLSTLRKFDGVDLRELTAAELKQIAGRAGRCGCFCNSLLHVYNNI